MSIVSIDIKLQPALGFEIGRIDYFESIVHDFIDIGSSMRFNIHGIELKNIKISRTINKSRDQYLKIGKEFSSNLKIEIPIPTTAPSFYRKIDLSKLSDEERKNQFREELILDICAEVQHLTILSNIAKPGAMKVRSAKCYLNNEFHSSAFKGYSLHRESLDYFEGLKWFEFQDMSIKNVLDWVDRNKISFQRISSNSTEIAINSFTQLFHEWKDSIVFDLFWALIGIEALYCTGKEALAKQIFEKTQVVLGEMSTFKKKLKEMYNFRSKLIHGSLNIAPVGYYTVDKEEEKIEEDAFESSCLAIAILTGSLQKLIIMDSSKFEFEHKLK